MTAIIVHGGAGEWATDRHARALDGVRRAAATGDAILIAGGSALDAVVAAVRVLEDDPEFNAGTGSALTRDGTVETDAAVMDGASRRVGAVGAVPDLGCAIALARAVLDAGEHVLLVGAAAWRFAAEVGIAPAPAGSLITERSRARLQAKGTVGACARDARGDFAAATSTGGITGKRSGRVGDSPIPGAGTWADKTCAVSATGDGEAILRVALARGIAARIAAGHALDAALADAFTELRDVTAATAGVIAVTRAGVLGAQMSPAMPIAWVTRDGDDAIALDSLGRVL
ncbi:MAG TPA: isoaspartyl peptidase/L-asparaginase [Kofleriaceae bacterium]|jgi:beta-aspartyl-peptidase (threonine type)